MNNKILYAILIISLGANAYFVIEHLKAEPQDKPIQKKQQVLEKVEPNDDEVTFLANKSNPASFNRGANQARQNEELEAKVAALETQVEELKKTKFEGSFSDDIDTDDPAIAKALEASSSAAERFEIEAIDYAWSNATKNKLDQVFVDNALNSELQIKEMECKTTVCKLSVSPFAGSSNGHLMGAGMRVIEAIRESGQDDLTELKSTFMLESDKGQIDIILYNNQ